MSDKKTQAGVHGGVLPDGKGHSSVVKDASGVPQAEPPRHKSLLGTLPVPDTGGKVHLDTEKTKAQVEILLLKGLTSYSGISVTLGISPATAKKYVEEVKYRWAVLGGMPRMRQLRGEAKSRLELITTELWVMYQNTTAETIKGACLRQLIEVHDRQLLLDGITVKTLPALVNDSLDGLDLDVSSQIADHTKTVELGRALLVYVSKMSSPNAVDGEYIECTEDE